VVRVSRAGERRLELRRWGLVPRWARDPAIGSRLINARSESAAGKPAFRDALRRRRCLVPADGFYEWKQDPGLRRPHHLHLPGRALFAFAGLYERWRSAEDQPPLETCTLLTTAANERVRPLHDRMPLILDPDAYAAWLDPDLSDPDALRLRIGSKRSDALCFHPVGLRVNDPRNDDPRCLEDEPPPQRELF
jgi:putative SOS response-associated peptidase YedK